MARKRSVSKKRGRKGGKRRPLKGVRKRGRKKAKHVSKSKFAIAIKRLIKLKKPQRQQAMSLANDGFIRQFCSKVRNLRRAKLSAKTRKALRKHRKKLQKLMNKRTSVSQKRAILSQRGGGVSVMDVILTALPFVAAFL